MVDLRALETELAMARRARREAEMAGLSIERVIAGMQAGRTLQQIELEEAESLADLVDLTEVFAGATAFRQAA